MRILCYSAAKNEMRPKTANTVRTIWSGTHPTFSNKSHTGRYTAKQGVFCSQYRFLLLSLFWVSENMTFKCLSKLAVTHKLRQRLNTARTIWTGTHPSLLNNSHTGRHAVKQGRKIHFTLQQASSVTKEIAFLCLASQILNSPIARFLLYTTCIVKRVSATGKYRYDHYQSVKSRCCSQTATKAQHRANNPVGHTPVLPQQIAHRAIHGETGR